MKKILCILILTSVTTMAGTSPVFQACDLDVTSNDKDQPNFTFSNGYLIKSPDNYSGTGVKMEKTTSYDSKLGMISSYSHSYDLSIHGLSNSNLKILVKTYLHTMKVITTVENNNEIFMNAEGWGPQYRKLDIG